MIALYGMKQLAERYLMEMYSGLLRFRKKSRRFMLFSAQLGLFPDCKLELPVQASGARGVQISAAGCRA